MQDYSLQTMVHKTLLNSTADVFMKIFKNSRTEDFGKYPGKRMYCSTRSIKSPLQILP